MSKCWMNGKLLDEDHASISIRDAGLLHGTGAFTTMRAYQGKAFRLADHMARLRHTCQTLQIPLSTTDAMIASTIDELVQANLLVNARLRLTVTRGVAGPEPFEPNVFITAVALEAYPAKYYEQGMTAIAYDQQKLNPYDIQAGHKTLDYFSRLTAMRDAAKRSAGEALWFNVHNYLQSGSISNVFLVKEGTLLTPPTQQDLEDGQVRQRTAYPRSNVLPGITRKTVLELAAKENIPVRIGGLSVNDLLSADECFITNSIMEVMPVCRIERKALGNDKPGDLTRRITMLYRNAVDQYVVSA